MPKPPKTKKQFVNELIHAHLWCELTPTELAAVNFIVLAGLRLAAETIGDAEAAEFLALPTNPPPRAN